MTSQQLLILGASTRAAAWSALRAGLEPICADLFLDTDLQAIARVLPVTTYPQGLWSAVEDLPPTPWIYTGGLENSLELIAAISTRHPLQGVTPQQVKVVRDPWWLRQTFATGPVKIPELRESDDPPSEGQWLSKPRASSGGRGISIWNPSTASTDSSEPFYFQEFIPGRSVSALYLGTEQGALLLGTASQLAPPVQSLHPFAYFGSSVPAGVSEETLQQMAEVGETLMERIPLRGLFGCDFLLGTEGLFLLEVNPRYTASVELHEHALQAPLLGWHLAACGGELSRSQFENWEHHVSRHRMGEACFAKRILYAEREGAFPYLPELLGRLPGLWDVPRFADLPAPGASFRAGDPVCSLLAQGKDPEEIERNLQESEHLLGLTDGEISRGNLAGPPDFS